MNTLSKEQIATIKAALYFWVSNTEDTLEREELYSYVFKDIEPLENWEIDSLINCLDINQLVEVTYGKSNISKFCNDVFNVKYRVEFIVCFEDGTWNTEGYLYFSEDVPENRIEDLAKEFWIKEIAKKTYPSKVVSINIHRIEDISYEY